MAKKEVTHLYKKIFDDLKALIEEGRYKKGDLLPSENELCREYSTTRVTIRQALSALANMGYIIRKHGKGSIVAEPKSGLGILSLNGVTAGVGTQNLTTSILQKPVRQAWPVDFFFELEPEETNSGCLYFARLRSIDDVPVLYEETFIANIDLPKFTSKNLENKSLFKILKEKYNVEVTEGEQKIWAVHGDKNISKILGLKTTHPILHMKRRMHTNVKGLRIYSSLYCNTEEHFLQDSF
ncbi:GntR family transcriptional regulator [Mucilaginibacter myungsuensis]|uniref:GntR family transcriptional regulator n=1 Tax=Mucilaginibacter myungsuensis TaxID=649104 RepID=A0A929PW45_9SPHI|nr:GntR family transcriptional regulator [Mucilaginibacter myungsuensis]MBE9660787.1 GntR family transcriptional regulator [Mucilaginibacter myungsuensis]MDN3600833.1 GntR family transcriptional regulator [Mucilaginibacter myungsuensis]